MEKPNGWAGVEDALRRHLHQPDLQAARCLYAAVASHRLQGQLVWPMVVAPPGSGKTLLVEALDKLPGLNVHLIDSVTPQTFLSGQIPDPTRPSARPASLLHRIGSGVIVAPDFSTVLAIRGDKRDAIFADLRRIYDGTLRKEFGTDCAQSHEWKGRITFVAAVTPEIDRYCGVFQSLGERFLSIRWSRPDGVKAAKAAMRQDGPAAKLELHEALADLFSGQAVAPELPVEIADSIAALAEFTVRARTHVARSSYGKKEIIELPQPEAPTRLAQQLCQLAKGSALLDGRTSVDAADYQLAQRAALDCVPPIRRALLDALIAGQEARTAKLPDSTRSYAIEDLRELDLMDSKHLSGLAWDLLGQAGFDLPSLPAKAA